MVSFDLFFETDWAKVFLITATYQAPYTEQDYNVFSCISFPLQSCFGYRIGKQECLLDSNQVLYEKADTAFWVRKLPGFQADKTLSVQLTAFPEHPDWPFLEKDTQVVVQKRTPEIEVRLQSFLKNTPEVCRLKVEQSLTDLLKAAFWPEARNSGLLPENPNFNHFRQVEQAKSFMHAYFDEDLTLSQIAQTAHFSPFHFSRIFRRFTGYSPYVYLSLVRIENAKRFLCSGVPVSQTAFQTGFNSIENFSLIFKKITGLAPSDFKKSKIY